MESLDLHLVCPYCLVEGEKVSHVTPDAVDVPHEGALSFCMACGEFSIFMTPPAGLRKRQPWETGHIDQDPECVEILRQWKEL